jgi:DNA-binding CsgD family transcriptional regulator
MPRDARTPPRDLRSAEFEVGGERFVVVSYSAGESHGLTPAEADVVAQVLDGSSAVAIAAARGTSVRTINKQLEAAYRKLGVSSRAELAARLGRR